MPYTIDAKKKEGDSYKLQFSYKTNIVVDKLTIDNVKKF